MSAPAPEPVPAGNRSGSVLAQRYRLQHRLSMGGMGEVYAARHTEIPRRFAIKLLRTDYAHDAQMRARFRNEAETAAGLSSEHIVAVTDFGYADDGSPFLVMELLEGADLRQWLDQLGRPSVEQAALVIAQACTGLAVAHAGGVVHRDLKPENLFIASSSGRTTVKVLDFGIAKLRDQSMGTGGRLLGTPEYMPPEQVRGEPTIDQRADVYALGVILYEMLTGFVPHPGKGQHAIITHILFEDAIPIRELNPAVSEALASVIHKAIAPRAGERFQSIGELAEALAPFAGRAVLPAAGEHELSTRPTQPARTSGVGHTAPAAAPIVDAPAALPARGRGPRFALGLGIAVIALAASLFALQQRRMAESAAPSVAAAPSIGPERSPAMTHVTVPDTAAPVVQPAAVAPRRMERSVRSGKKPGARAGKPVPSGAALIEVKSGDATLLFRRDNPLSGGR
jgi:serine/threonine-protein kinase